MAKEIITNVHWLGVSDIDSKDFHGIPTPLGGSYNSFLIQDEKPTIVDTASKKYVQKLLDSLGSVIEPSKIAYIVINHAEPDHAGGLNIVLTKCTNATIICTAKCKEFLLAQHYGIENREFLLVKDTDTISIGKKTLQFYLDPFVHWPETMMTYLVEDKALLCADLCATEIAHNGDFATNPESYQKLTRDYFALVMRPYAKPVQKTITRVREIKPEYLFSSHGLLYDSSTMDSILNYYEKLATNPEEERVVILYSSAWGTVAKVATHIEKRLHEQGIQARCINMLNADMPEVMAECLTAKIVCMGTITLIGSYHPSYDYLLPFLRLNNQPGKRVFMFGNYGWSAGGVSRLTEKLKEMKYEILGSYEVQFSHERPELLSKLDEYCEKIVVEFHRA